MKEILTVAFALALTLGVISTYTSIRGTVYAQAGTTSGNVTAQVAPQGTSLKPPNAGSANGNVTRKG
jgi:hypothetical protein